MTQLPLFTLPLVLFPGAKQMLHIFEPRYRELLAYCLTGDRLFGLVYSPPDRQGPVPEPGDIGCGARIESHRGLPDGRSNVLIVGEDRFVLRAIVPSSAAYDVGSIEPIEDNPCEATVAAELMEQVRRRFETLLEATHDPTDHHDALGQLPDDPTAFAFKIMTALDLDVATSEALVRLVSPETRLRRLDTLLETAARDLIAHRAMKRVARGNGRGNNPELQGRQS